MQAVRQHLCGRMQAHNIPGLAIAIAKEGNFVAEYYLGHANLEHRVAVTAQTVFEIASITKLFTAQAILYLAQEKLLSLDDPLHQYVPDIPQAWHPVTIKHCLMHQSGIASYTEVDAYWQQTKRDKSLAEVIDLVRHLPLRFSPGRRVAYDNTGFYLLGRVIEAVSAMTYGDFLKRRIFEPLRMHSTRINDYAAIIPQRASGYNVEDSIIVNKPFYSTSNTFSAGNIVSTARDLLTWRRSLFNDAILNATMRDMWWTAHPSHEQNERQYGYSMGLGWFLVDHPAGQFWGHNGNITGYASAFLHFTAEKVTAVALCNAGQISTPHEIAIDVIKRHHLL